LILISFAFLAGVVTIVSPCVLPILPVVLSGSLGSGKLRPWGIITGFIASFTLFTLTLSSIVQIFHVSPDILRWVASGFILLFGLVMVIPQLKEAFMALASRITASSTRPRKAKGGYFSGLLLGFSLGLVWTPCVGPIMASVVSLAMSQAVDAGAVFITLSYSVGAAVPLLLLVLGGQGLLKRFPGLVKNTGKIQKIFGVVMVLTALALFTGFDRTVQTWLLETFPQYGSSLNVDNQNTVQKALDARQKQ
ncbi:MAG: cytochrome c biogenesis protein CcdA, partial [Spirochaetales bacterium]|nr:cytochrome c biogenesis protein CcdA [Spirochaetales bacterium]